MGRLFAWSDRATALVACALTPPTTPTEDLYDRDLDDNLPSHMGGLTDAAPLVSLIYRSLAALVACGVALDAAGRALTHALPLPAALGYGAGVTVLVLYAAGAMEPAERALPDSPWRAARWPPGATPTDRHDRPGCPERGGAGEGGPAREGRAPRGPGPPARRGQGEGTPTTGER